MHLGVRENQAPRSAFRAALGSKPGAAGVWMFALLFLVCLCSVPWTAFAPDGAEPMYKAQDLTLSFSAPWWACSEEGGGFLGRDQLGRSIAARTLAGGGISIGIGLSASLLSVCLGTAYGIAAAYYGGRIDAVMMRIVDVLYGLPYILLVVLLAVAVEAVFGRTADGAQLINVLTLLVAIGGVSWLTMARVIRGQVLSLTQQPFMEAARAAGASAPRQVFKHLLPNLVGPIVVYGALTAPQAILQESFLSFLGIGVREPLPSLGNLVASGLGELNTVSPRWWLLLFPSLVLGALLVSLNLVGEGLREAFDPKRGNG